MRARRLLPALLLLALPSLAAAAPIPIGGQISNPGGALPKDARALLIPLVSQDRAGSLELEGKAGPEPVASVPVSADGTFRLEAPEAGMWKVVVQAAGFVPKEIVLLPLLEETELAAVQLDRDAKLEVRVTGPDGRPLAGARVRAGEPERRFSTGSEWRVPSRTGLTDAQGKVALPRAASESLLVGAGAAGLPFVEKKDVRTSTVTLGLPAGTSRDIRVLDAAGKPVAGALVRLGDNRWAAGRTAADGTLAVPLPGKEKLRVAVTPGGAGDGRSATVYLAPKRPEETGPRDLRLPAVETLAGRVVSAADGRPMAGALVWADDPGAPAKTGADGGYRLSGPVGRELFLGAAAPGFFQETGRRLVQAGDRKGPTLALEPALTAAGVVVDEQGRPVPGVEVKASVETAGPMRSARMFESGGTARTSAAGRFRIRNLMAGVGHQLKLSRKGYAPLTADLPPVEPGRAPAEQRFVLLRGRMAFGRVVGPNDQPVAGARVVVRPAPAGDRMAMMMRMFRSADDDQREAAADVNGRFEIPDLPAGTFELTARGSGYAPITVPGLEIPAGGGATDLGTVMLVQGVALEGFVVDPKGRPVEGAEVFVAEATGDIIPRGRPDSTPAAVTGQDGFFRVDDRRAGETVNVDVRRPGFAAGGAPGVLAPTEEPVRIVLKPTSAVEGRVVDADGKAVAGARVALVPTEPTAMSRGFMMFSTSGTRNALSADDGSFRLEDVAPGPVELRAEAAGKQTGVLSNLEVASGQDLKGVEVVLATAAVVEGRVLASGRPVPGAEVQIVEPDMGRGTRFFMAPMATSDGDGYYRLDGVAPGTRTVQVEHKSHSKAVRELEVRAGANSLDISLEKGAEVSGRVVDADGRPVPSARVLLYEGNRFWDLPSATSGADGSFTLEGVADGTYRVKAEKEGFAGGEGEEVTVAGSVGGVEVKLSTGGAIVGQLKGLDFTELSQVRVMTLGFAGSRTGRVSPDGSYRIDNVGPGEHRVSASVRGEREAEGKVILEPGETEVRLDLDFVEGLVLTGRVTRNGEPATGYVVTLEGPSERLLDTDHEGRFRFDGLEPGRYELAVMSRRMEGAHKETLELTRDDEIEIRLATAALTGRVVDSSDRSPVSGATVSLLAAEGDEDMGFFTPESRTDSEGVFRLPDVPEGSWRVRAVLAGYGPGEVDVRVDADSPPEELEIPLQVTEGVTLEVALSTGRWPRSVRTAVIDPAGRVVASSTYPTGENGRLRVASVAPGSWDLLLDADAAAPVVVPVTAPGHAGRVVLPLPGSLDLKVPALAESRVGAKVRLTDANGKPYRNAWQPGRTDIDLHAGARKLERLAPGTWKIDVTADDGRTWSATATVTAGSTEPVTLQ